MITPHAFKTCLSKTGDTSSHILGIKRFLNGCYGVKSLSLSNDYTFCEKTAEALAEFQQFKGLSATGRMNVETWREIGKDLGIVRFEMLFFHTANHKTIHKLAFGNKFAPLFPTRTHNALIEYAFLEGGGTYAESGNIGGGLSKAEVDAIALGSRQVDTYFGHGYGIGDIEFDIWITLIISEAYKHAMVPEGTPRQDAIDKSHGWIKDNTDEAWKIQKEADAKADKIKQDFINQHNQGKPVPSPGPDPNISLGKLVSSALTAFGKACHTYMDSLSPAHHGWQEYKMPKMTVKNTDPETGIPIGEEERRDWIKFAQEGLQHKADESEEPTPEQKEKSVLCMRGAFLTTFTNKWFKRAVKTESEREKTYSYLRGLGMKWEEDFGIDSPPQIKIPK